MKKLLVFLIGAAVMMAESINATAQYATPLYRKGTSLYSDGTKLTKEQMQVLLDGTDGLSYSDWKKASAGFNAGKGLLIGFGALTGTGLVTLSVGVVGVMMEGIAVGTILGPVSAMTGEPLDYKSKFAGAVHAGVYMIGGGLLCMVTGTTVYCVYKKKLKNMTELCNGSSKDIRLSFGAKKHGIGLSLDF